MGRVFQRSAGLVLGLLCALAPMAVAAQTAVENSSEIRFQLDLKVPQAAHLLQEFLETPLQLTDVVPFGQGSG